MRMYPALIYDRTIKVLVTDLGVWDESKIMKLDISRLKRLLKFFRQRRKNFKLIPHDSVISELENRSVLIGVDRDNVLTRSHAGKMLNGSRDAAGNI